MGAGDSCFKTHCVTHSQKRNNPLPVKALKATPRSNCLPAGAAKAPYRFRHAVFQRIGGQPVADRNFSKRGNAFHQRWQVFNCQIMAINAWNRVNVGFKTVPGSADKAYGLDKAGLN